MNTQGILVLISSLFLTQHVLKFNTAVAQQFFCFEIVNAGSTNCGGVLLGFARSERECCDLSGIGGGFTTAGSEICESCLSIAGCPSLENPANGQVSVLDLPVGSNPTAIAVYSCNSNFGLVGSPRRDCSNGMWTGIEPTCREFIEPSVCPTDIVLATCPTVTPVCPPTVTCPTCEICTTTTPCREPIERQCPTLASPLRGNVLINASVIGLQADYSCDFGYDLIGSPIRECLPSRSWSGGAPVCILTLCPSLTNPTNGIVFLTTRAVGGAAFYICLPNHLLRGPGRRQCLSDGTWSSIEPFCDFQSAFPTVGFELNGLPLVNGSTVNINDIGSGDSALLCVTDRRACCNSPHPKQGEFYFPNGQAVGFSNINSLYRNRGDQVVRLNRRGTDTPLLGVYRCDIPDSNGNLRSIFINIGNLSIRP